MKSITIPECLKEMESFSRNEYNQVMNEKRGLTEPQSKYELQKALDSGEIIRKGWNHYTITKNRKVYKHSYSGEAEDVANLIEENYYDADFQVFEMTQLNQFMNHLVAHNTIFVAVEHELVEFVFDTLNKKYPGRVMLKPSLKMYFRYLQDDEIVVTRLPSETPKGIDKPWQARIEKILVDVLTDKLIGGIVPDGEKAAIVKGAYHDFIIDEGTMMRYAKRKGAVGKMVDALNEYGRTVTV